jgi:hypothetical protein
MAERTPEDVVAGVLRISIGGTERLMPTLKARWVGEWSVLLGDPATDAKPIGEWTMDDVTGLSGRTVDHLLDLVVAYDRTSALGGREWLAENADPAQLHAALVQMVGNAFPLADEPAVLVAVTLARLSAPSARPPSTNGASTNGVAARKRSGRSLTRSR